MVVSSQEVYNRLLLHSPDSNQLKFETLALVAHGSNGTLDEDKLKDLIHLFRPERDGKSLTAGTAFVTRSRYVSNDLVFCQGTCRCLIL